MRVVLRQAEGGERGNRGAAQGHAQHDSREHVAEEVHTQNNARHDTAMLNARKNSVPSSDGGERYAPPCFYPSESRCAGGSAPRLPGTFGSSPCIRIRSVGFRSGLPTLNDTLLEMIESENVEYKRLTSAA